MTRSAFLVIVEHSPDVVLRTIQSNPSTYEWFANEWIHLVVAEPLSGDLYYFQKGAFVPYQPITTQLERVTNIDTILATNQSNLPVYYLD